MQDHHRRESVGVRLFLFDKFVPRACVEGVLFQSPAITTHVTGDRLPSRAARDFSAW